MTIKIKVFYVGYLIYENMKVVMEMRVYLNLTFTKQKHFINYCRKIVSNKMGNTSFVGRKKFTNMVSKMWMINDKREIENFLYRIQKATPEQIEASLRRLRGDVKPKTPARYTGMYGVWSAVSNRFVFGIQKPSRSSAHRQLIREIGRDSMKYRFRVKPIKDCALHREMFRDELIFKEVGEETC